ncbi:MAG: ribosome silencing factor [Leptospiraceae bacterium]|nr:ribosome silencing factor [Leptospiraceae bacterium]MCK6379744.1 ribosome silencing factor [Leptospiraceae bacterium]NUM40424.1 ribosome silencing factor [Leptospiraceae bacterium]
MPQKKEKYSDTKKILLQIQTILASKKCEEISILNLENVNSYLSYFVICTVMTSIQAQATARELEKSLKHLKLGKGNQSNGQGSLDSGWILLDFGEILVHIMTKEKRNFYDLERLWGDAKPVKLS